MKYLILPLVMAGCAATTPPPAPAPAPGAGKCDAAAAQGLVGRKATPHLVNRAKRLSGARLVRRIAPNMRVTMDYREDRVNVWVSLNDRAERITCG